MFGLVGRLNVQDKYLIDVQETNRLQETYQSKKILHLLHDKNLFLCASVYQIK